MAFDHFSNGEVPPYEMRPDGLVKDYDEALRVLHDLAGVIIGILDLPTNDNAPDLRVSDVIAPEIVEAIVGIASGTHFLSCTTRLSETEVVKAVEGVPVINDTVMQQLIDIMKGLDK